MKPARQFLAVEPQGDIKCRTDLELRFPRSVRSEQARQESRFPGITRTYSRPNIKAISSRCHTPPVNRLAGRIAPGRRTFRRFVAVRRQFLQKPLLLSAGQIPAQNQPVGDPLAVGLVRGRGNGNRGGDRCAQPPQPGPEEHQTPALVEPGFQTYSINLSSGKPNRREKSSAPSVAVSPHC